MAMFEIDCGLLSSGIQLSYVACRMACCLPVPRTCMPCQYTPYQVHAMHQRLLSFKGLAVIHRGTPKTCMCAYVRTLSEHCTTLSLIVCALHCSGNLLLHNVSLSSGQLEALVCPSGPTAIRPGTAYACEAFYTVNITDLELGQITFSAAGTFSSVISGAQAVAAQQTAALTMQAQPQLELDLIAGSCNYSSPAGGCMNSKWALQNGLCSCIQL